jgi:zinc protease
MTDDHRKVRKGIACRAGAVGERRKLICAFLLFVSSLLVSARASARSPWQDLIQPFPPPAPLPKPYFMPAPSVRTLANGLTVVTIERHDLPLVTLRWVVRAGAEADPADAPGTAQLVSALINQGTGSRSADQIAELIDSAGGTIDTGADWDTSYVELSVLSDHTDHALGLLADMIRRSSFDPAEVERKRRQILSALEVAYQDPGYVADTAFDDLSFAGTAYGHPQDGTMESVRRLTAADLRAFHSRYYRPENSILAAVGDLTPDAAFELARRYFGDWPRSADREAKPGSPPAKVAPQNLRIVAIEKPDAVQTEIRVGTSGIRRDSADYVALTVANQVLGGPAANRLFSALRTKRGLTYGASSDLECYRTAGSWETKTFTRTAETFKTLEVILREMRDLHDQTITESELRAAKSYLVGHLALQFESSDSVARHVLDLMVHGLPLDYWNKFPAEVNALTVEDVQAAIRRTLDPDRPVIVLVGNVGGFTKDLKKLGPARVIPLPTLDFGSVSLEREKGTGDKP